MNVSKDRTSHIQEQGIKNCKRAGRFNTKKPQGLKGRQANSQFDSGQGQHDFGKSHVPSTHRFTRSMAAQKKKTEPKYKMLIHVQLSSSTSLSTRDDSHSTDSHYSPPMSSPVAGSSFPIHSSASRVLKSDQKSVKSHRSATSAQGVEYFQQRNLELTK